MKKNIAMILCALMILSLAEMCIRDRVDTKFVLFHKENHELSRSGRPKNRIKRMDLILSWFDGYLK